MAYSKFQLEPIGSLKTFKIGVDSQCTSDQQLIIKLMYICLFFQFSEQVKTGYLLKA